MPRATETYNLQIINPRLSQEWHPTKNGDLTPKDVTPNSNKKVWWLCNSKHEWKRSVRQRNNRGRGCPYCAGQAVCEDNCLATVNPQLAKEWHPAKNGNLTPNDVTSGSGKRVWWLCKKKKHEWKASVNNRNKGRGCPYCAGQAVCEDNCLATVNPQLAKEWHPTKNGSLTPNDVLPNSGKKVWWKCGRGHEWETYIYSRNSGRACPDCVSKTSQLELRIFSEFKYLFKKVIHRKKIDGYECDIFIPKLKVGIELDSLYWHKDKFNKDREKTLFLESIGIQLFRLREKGLKKISSNDIIFSKKPVEFELLKRILNKLIELVDVPEDIEYKINEYLKNCKLENDKEYFEIIYKLPSPLPGYSLYDINKPLAKEWHPTKNGLLTPKDVSPNTDKIVWWLCTKKKHEWRGRIQHRNNGIGCPYCSGRYATKETSLQVANPELAREWHPTKNDSLTPAVVKPNSHKKVWWLCKEKGHEWKASIANRHRKGYGCPYCSGRRK